MARYGQKGGDGPDTGKKATTYETQLPDGTHVRKRSFHHHGEHAYIGVYQHEGVWCVAGVTDEVQEIGGARHPIYGGASFASTDQIALAAWRV